MNAPGAPGNKPAWSRSAKDTIGTSLGSSELWFTIGRGVLNEVFWPSCSTPQIRDLGFIVAGEDFWIEVKRENHYEINTSAPDVPLPRIVHSHRQYELELEVLADPWRDVVLIRYHLKGNGLKLYALIAPHLDGSGLDNSAVVVPQGLAATGSHSALLLAADRGFSRSSAGYVGASDGWQDFHQNGAMTWEYEAASNGNVALMGELNENSGVLALGFAQYVEGACTVALSSLAAGFEEAREPFIDGWRRWAGHLSGLSPGSPYQPAMRRAAMVLKAHVDRTFPGGVVASLSTPWGFTHDDPGGYHLVWPRDAVEAGFAMLACGNHREARSMLSYLIATQQADGHWLQNFYADGRPYWTGVQLDEAAFPVLLAAKLDEVGELANLRMHANAMVRRALGFIARTGPSSEQDRWEENAGLNPFTVAVAIAALVAGAAHGFLDSAAAKYAASLADDWNARIESWLYVAGSDLDRKHGTAGHYVRLVPPGQTAARGVVELKNRDGAKIAAADLIGLEYLYLVRLGLRHADDPAIVDTTKLVDKILRVETPTGAFYHRYNGDGYGEHADGSAFNGTGIGRAWPLLSGERGHYALMAGEDPKPYLDAMLGSASSGGMIPEQVWDTDPIPKRGLEPGRPSGSAMPLVWAHGEFLKLAMAVGQGEPIERLPAVVERYRNPATPKVTHWREVLPCRSVNRNGELLVEAEEPFVLHLGCDGWNDLIDTHSEPTAFGLHGARVDVSSLGARQSIEFTRRFKGERGWEGQNWRLLLLPLSPSTR